MAKFSIQVVETNKAWFVVEADTPEQAMEAFEEWADRDEGDDAINIALSNGFEGWEFIQKGKMPEQAPAIISYAEIFEGGDNNV